MYNRESLATASLKYQEILNNEIKIIFSPMSRFGTS